jgi:pSer/pThr/pTyr-binding forkhead associated (FHA) protein
MLPPKYMDTDLILYVLSAGDYIPLTGQNKFSLGRASEEPAIRPDVDLTPYHAYEMGVSRLHALIRISDNEVSLTDLDSVNGTSINNEHILPKSRYSLQDGDIISMGKLKLRVFIPE